MIKMIFVLFYLFTITSCFKEGIDLSKYQWKNITTFNSRGLDNKMIQGAAYYNEKYYQFHDQTGGIRIFDAKTRIQIGEIQKLNCDKKLHHGSASFSKEFSYLKDGKEIKINIPLVYSSGHYDNKEVIDVIDIENDVLVRQYFFPNRRDDVIGAWDWDNKRFWIIGYEPESGYAITPYFINEYKFNDDGSFEPVGDAVMVKIKDATLQDCHYVDGHIFILSGWGPSHGQHVILHDYNVNTKNIEYSNVSPTTNEGEGLGYIPESKSFIVTTWTGSVATYWEISENNLLQFLS